MNPTLTSNQTSLRGTKQQPNNHLFLRPLLSLQQQPSHLPPPPSSQPCSSTEPITTTPIRPAPLTSSSTTTSSSSHHEPNKPDLTLHPPPLLLLHLPHPQTIGQQPPPSMLTTSQQPPDLHFKPRSHAKPFPSITHPPWTSYNQAFLLHEPFSTHLTSPASPPPFPPMQQQSFKAQAFRSSSFPPPSRSLPLTSHFSHLSFFPTSKPPAETQLHPRPAFLFRWTPGATPEQTTSPLDLRRNSEPSSHQPNPQPPAYTQAQPSSSSHRPSPSTTNPKPSTAPTSSPSSTL